MHVGYPNGSAKTLLLDIDREFPNLVVSNLVVSNFYAEALFCALLRSVAPFCALLRSFADSHLLSFALISVFLRFKPCLERLCLWGAAFEACIASALCTGAKICSRSRIRDSLGTSKAYTLGGNRGHIELKPKDFDRQLDNENEFYESGRLV